jgi:hypothetical protein
MRQPIGTDWEPQRVSFFGGGNLLAGTSVPSRSLFGRTGGLHIMDRSHRYKRFASECLELARTAPNERSKVTLLPHGTRVEPPSG